MSTTLVRYIKVAKNDSYMFKVERIDPEDSEKLYISSYNDSEWIFIVPHKLRPRDIILKPQRIYELDISVRKWNGLHIKVFKLSHTLETIEANEKITKYFKPKVC